MRRATALTGLVLALAVVTGARPAAATAAFQAGERITSYDEKVVIQQDASLMVTETIAYDFGSTPRHGIFRDIPVRFDYDPDRRYERINKVEGIKVTAEPAGTPTQTKVEESGRLKRIRIGDPDRTITGEHVYTIQYRVLGAVNGFPDHDELFWNAVGTGWEVPIAGVRVTVESPAPIAQAACFAGPQGSRLGCRSARVDGTTALFSHGLLQPHEGVTVVVGLPLGAVNVPPPLLDEKWSLTRAFQVTPVTAGGAVLLMGAIGFGVVKLLRRGRDRRYAGSHVDVAFGNVSGQEETVPLFERQHDPVEFEPPDRIRPGQLGTLIDEVANPLDVTATLIDLAVRGYLQIEEIPKQGRFSKPDWLLVKVKEPDGLLDYERTLHEGLFRTGDQVKLSDLKQKFADRFKKVQNALYDDVVKAGWFSTRPDHVRTLWIVLGVVAVVVAVLITMAMAALTHAALLAVPLLVGAVALLIGARKAPRRTPKGFAVLRRANGFRQFIEESEKERARFAERANLFSEYLPYAIVFGCTDKWAKAFAGLDQEIAESTHGWYISPYPFAIASFSDSMDGFAVTTSGTIVASAASSGSSGFGGGGFSGGGFGGGGGGSW
ncbi:MAG: DUF2207 domain-containing protein [Acidimicrobiales bacterium]